jgi:hypothetical protein
MVSILEKSYNYSIAQFYNQKEHEDHDTVPFMVTMLGAFILVFILLVLIFAPGKTTARYGIIIDPPDTAIAQKQKTSHFSVLLIDVKALKVRKPEWFVHSKKRSIVLRETTTMFLRTKKYSFYNDEKAYHQERIY